MKPMRPSAIGSCCWIILVHLDIFSLLRNSIFAKGWLCNLQWIYFHCQRLWTKRGHRSKYQTQKVEFIVLPMKHKNIPSSTRGNNKHGHPLQGVVLLMHLCRYTIFRSMWKSSLLTHVSNRKYMSSALSNKCCHAKCTWSTTVWK